MLQLVGKLRIRQWHGLELNDRGKHLSSIPRLKWFNLDVEKATPGYGIAISLHKHRLPSGRAIGRNVTLKTTENT
jgi:hypothetical protein